MDLEEYREACVWYRKYIDSPETNYVGDNEESKRAYLAGEKSYLTDILGRQLGRLLQALAADRKDFRDEYRRLVLEKGFIQGR